MRTNRVLLLVIALAAVSLLALKFSGAATMATTAPARHYYLTKATVNGDQTLTACASGYHFASFAELGNPTVLSYNKTLGRSAADDGYGPPTAAGWVRSGWSSNSVSGNDTPTNCNLWTSGAGSDDGEIAVFNPSISGDANGVGFSDIGACDNSQGVNIGVWCVQN
jgi:hypothetical protein